MFVEQVHVRNAQLGLQLELLLNARRLRRCEVLRRHRNHKMHSTIGVILLVVRDEWLGVLFFWREHFFKEFFIV